MDLFDSLSLISPLTWLIMGHAAGDFLLQSRWMAMNKNTNNRALLAHVLVYTLAVGLFSLSFGGMHYSAYLLIFLVHLALDRRVFVAWWARFFTRSSGNDAWQLVVIDQIFHLYALVCALYLSRLLS